MRNLFKTISVIALAASSFTAMAQGTVAASYANLSADDLSFGTINIHAAYEFRAQSTDFSLMPEIRLGTGIKDDQLFGVNVEIDEFQSFALKLNYYVSDTVAVFLAPSYARLGIKGSARGFSASDSETEFGFGAGVTAKFSDEWAAEASYERFDDVDVLSAGIRYYF